MSLIEAYLEAPSAGDAASSDIAEDWEKPSKTEGTSNDQQGTDSFEGSQKRTGSRF